MDELSPNISESRVLYICSTYYHVYITLLKQLAEPVNADLVVCDDIPTGEQLTDRLKETKLLHRVWFVRQSLLPEERGKTILDWILFQHRRRYRAVRPMLPFEVTDYRDVYIYHDGTPLGMYLADARKPYHLIEDSLNFYQRVRETAQARLLKPHNWKYKIRHFLNSGYFPLGESRYVLDIEVNDKHNLQIRGRKIVELPRTYLRDRVSPEDDALLLKVFECPELPRIDGKCALILTEPLFADGVCRSMQEQIQIYEDMSKQLMQLGYCVIIKPHPRDEANYSRVATVVLDRYFPIELLDHTPVPRPGCVAAKSSSVLSRGANQILVWDDNKQRVLKTENN